MPELSTVVDGVTVKLEGGQLKTGDVEAMPTAEVDASKQLAPNGAGGVEWVPGTSGGGGALGALDYDSKLTVITALNTPTVIIPSPPVGKLRMVWIDGSPFVFDGMQPGFVFSNDSGGDVDLRVLFGSVDLGSPTGGGPLGDGVAVSSAQRMGFASWFLMDSTEDLKVELLSGSEVQVFATWFDLDATNIGTTRLSIADTALHTLIPAPAAGKLHGVLLFHDAVYGSNLQFSDDQQPQPGAKWWVDDNGTLRSFFPIVGGNNPGGNPFARIMPNQPYYLLREGQALKLQFDFAPTPTPIAMAFAYRILDA